MHNLSRNDTKEDPRGGILVLEVSHRARARTLPIPFRSEHFLRPRHRRRTYKISSIFSTFGTDGRAPQRVFTAHRARPFRRDLSRWIIGMPEIPYHYPARSRSRFVRARVRAEFTTRRYRGSSVWTLDRMTDYLSILRYRGIDPVPCIILQFAALNVGPEMVGPQREICIPAFIYFLFNFASLFRVGSRIDANIAKVALFSPCLFSFLF